jgi:hypothetical protein
MHKLYKRQNIHAEFFTKRVINYWNNLPDTTDLATLHCKILPVFLGVKHHSTYVKGSPLKLRVAPLNFLRGKHPKITGNTTN